MRKLLLFIGFFLSVYNNYGQLLTVKDFLSVSSFTPKKFVDYISKKNFVLTDRGWHNDTMINTFNLRVKNSRADSQQTTRAIETYQSNKDFSFAFLTSSEIDYKEARKELKEEGFFCGNEDDSIAYFLYQRKNISVELNIRLDPEDTLYTFHFYSKELPQIQKIRFAEDLLPFTSHEYLVSVFGENNVKKDIYYFSEKEIAKCSVLFPYTKRQAVFIWKDEVNRCNLSSILIGGNLSTETSINYDKVIGENSWTSKEGVYSGMSLSNLARLNGKDFRFYGRNSEYPLMVVPENTGKVNFKKSLVVLGCLGTNSSNLLSGDIIKAKDVLQENPGIFVFMLMISPTKEE